MKKVLSAVFFLFFAASLIFAAEPVLRKPPPPPQLAAIFEDFSRLEANFKSGKWKDAIKATDRVYSTFAKILPQLKEHVLDDFIKEFSATMANLRNSLTKKDMQGAEEQYIRIQKLFLVIMGNYDYKVPPIMLIIDKYVFEAEQALEKKNFKRVVSEMDEVGDFFYMAEYLLRDKGAQFKDIVEFRRAVRVVRAAGEDKNSKEAEAGIKTLKALSDGFIRLF